MNILEEANKIVNVRSEEKERMYGDFEQGMTKAAKLASIMTNKNINTNDMYLCMVALKLSRQSYNHKEDNLLDAVAYLGSLNNYLSKQEEVKEFSNLDMAKITLDFYKQKYSETDTVLTIYPESSPWLEALPGLWSHHIEDTTTLLISINNKDISNQDLEGILRAHSLVKDL